MPTAIQHNVLSWYKQNKRELPWRNTTNPYYILLSEIMLQQTQVPRVIEKYTLFLQKYPTIQHLAQAPIPELLKDWSGLGYNRRALNLQKTVKLLSQTTHFPQTLEQLQQLPGIGPYTARAILSFAYNKDVAVVDINIKRIYSRVFATQNEREIEKIAQSLLPKNQSRNWNNALMDIGTLQCRPRPSCQGCPFSKTCQWNSNGSTIEIKAAKQSTFLGSNRYYRGNILKFLSKQKATAQQLLQQLPLEIQDKQRLQTALQQLLQEGFVLQEQKFYRLKS